MKRCRRLGLGKTLALCALAMPATVFAALPLPLAGTSEFEQLVAAAPIIVVGRCSAAHADWDAPHRLIHTTATYEVERWLKGSQPLEQVQVRLLGGTVGEITQTAVGAPAARLGERVVLFLTPEAGDRFVIVGWSRGKLPVESGASGGQTILAPTSDAEMLPARAPSGTALQAAGNAAPALALPVEALEKLIRASEKEAGR